MKFFKRETGLARCVPQAIQAGHANQTTGYGPKRTLERDSSQLSKDIVDDARDGAGSVDADPGRKMFSGTMVAEYQRTFVGLEAWLIWPAVQSSVQRLDIYVEHENLVEQVEKLMEVT
jgi:hypothetical protein